MFVSPAEGGLSIAAVDAGDWRSIVDPGWAWLTGDWVAARSVETVAVPRLRIAGRRPVLALFDGEPQMLEQGTVISTGRGREAFIATARR